MQRNALVPPDPETWQASDPVDRWTANTRGFDGNERSWEHEYVPPYGGRYSRVPDFDALTDEAIRSAG